MNKLLLYIIVLSCSTISLNAQTPYKPAAYTTGTTVNYVRTWNVQAPMTDPALISASTNLQEVTQTTQYIDGLGRPLQTVSKGTSPAGKDMVAPVVYDAYGREQYKFLPYASPTSTGSFKLDPFTEQANFYNTTNINSPINGQGEDYFYGQTLYEASPLNRVTEAQAPGDSWVGSSRGVETKYWTNTDLDVVQVWEVTNSTVAGIFGTYAVSATNPAYDAGQLYKTVTVDEHGKQVIEFKDKEGKVILKKVQLTATADNGSGKNHSGFLCTYYIYDDFGNLRGVIQPQGVETVKAARGSLAAWTFAVNDVLLDEQCFRYEYDGRNRLIMKKVPGAAAVNMVYDARDRLIMTQDGNMQVTPKKWLVTVYDALNRPWKTGLLTDANTAAYHQNLAVASSTYPVTSGTNFELLSETFYDNYTFLAASINPFTSTWASAEATSGFLTASNTVFPYPQSVAPVAGVTGLITGTNTKVLGTTSTFLYTVIYYDDHNRVIQTQSTNVTGGTDISTNQYSFDGKLLVNKTTHKVTSAATALPLITKNTYDAAGRLINITKNINNTGDHAVVDMTYDEISQLKTKKLAPAYNSNGGLANLTFDYNIRSWLLGLNRSQILTTNTPSVRKFGYELGYDKLGNTTGENFTAAQYNGNIAGVVWKSSGDGIRRKYDYTYDAANRLMRANFEQNNDGTAVWDTSIINYNVKMGDGTTATTAYDHNGNIKRMQQWGLEVTGSGQIDDLTYTYKPNSNQLLNVSDASNDPQTKLGDFRVSALNPVQTKTTTTADYVYDVNGNMVKDLNKDLGNTTNNGMVYNYLNLPASITVYKTLTATKGTITYTYDAAGNKLKKVTVDNTTTGKTITTTTTYIGGFVYESKTTSPADAANPNYTNVLQFISHEEGRIRRQPDATFEYDYFIKDHLGNVRMVLTEELQTDAYPVASMETAAAINEKLYYSKIDETRTAKPSGYPADTYTNPNAYAAKLNGSGQKIGPGIVLKVMAGDAFNIRVNSYYKLNGVTPGTPANPLTDLLSVLTSGVATASSGKVTQTQLSSSGVLSPEVTDFLSSQTVTTGKPKAYINWVFFDDQFKYVSTGSSFEQVGADLALTTHNKTSLPANKNGFLYVYVSNESPNIDVYFDNLQVTHIRGPMLEETHYYPFGLTMAGISSKAAGKLENRQKYGSKELQNQEFSDGSGLELYDYNARFQDPQIGRFSQQDPLSESYTNFNPYAFICDNPVNGIDPDGRDVIFLNDTKGANISGNVSAGHAAVIIGNPTDGWFYYSLNGTGTGQSAYGDSKDPDIGTALGHGTDIKRLITGENGANNINDNEKHDYDRYVVIKTTPEEDKAMKIKAEKAASVKKYFLMGQSCLNVLKATYEELVQGRVGYAHNYVDKIIRNDNIPNTWFKNLPGTFNNLNTFTARWGAGNERFFRAPIRTGKVYVGPSEKVEEF